MATLELSPALLSAGINAMFNPAFQAAVVINNNACMPFYSYIDPATTNCLNGIYIMQGTMPTDFSTLTSYSSRSADVLIAYPSNNGNFSGASYSGTAWVLATSNVLAAASGTATWFWSICLVFPATSTTATIWQQFMGTVGIEGSGADLIITDTAITAGNPYRITALTVNVSPTYTV